MAITLKPLPGRQWLQRKERGVPCLQLLPVWYAYVEGKSWALRPRQGSLLPTPHALRTDPSCFGLIACEQPLLVCGTWERWAALRFAHRRKAKTIQLCLWLYLCISRPEQGEYSRAAEPVKAKPSGLLRKP